MIKYSGFLLPDQWLEMLARFLWFKNFDRAMPPTPEYGTAGFYASLLATVLDPKQYGCNGPRGVAEVHNGKFSVGNGVMVEGGLPGQNRQYMILIDAVRFEPNEMDEDGKVRPAPKGHDERSRRFRKYLRDCGLGEHLSAIDSFWATASMNDITAVDPMKPS